MLRSYPKLECTILMLRSTDARGLLPAPHFWDPELELVRNKPVITGGQPKPSAPVVQAVTQVSEALVK